MWSGVKCDSCTPVRFALGVLSLWLPRLLGHMGRSLKTEVGEATQIYKLSLAVISQWPQ